MGKSSSSIKKKRSKSSSKQRSKNRRSKSKKLRRCDDSDNYSDNHSRSSMSVSSSSSEDSYRRSRSSTRKDVKGSKKRARARSFSREDSPHVRKQKASKRNDNHEVRKSKRVKNRKKKSRRDASVSSRSRSCSCSACRSPCDSRDDGEYAKNRGRLQRRDKDKGKTDIKSTNKKRRFRSRSCSSCSAHGGSSDYWTEEKMTSENSKKRLRSVITFTKENNEGNEMEKDELKEELIYVHDDYPSSRSNDSNDWRNERDLANQPYLASEKKGPTEDDKRDDAVASKIKATLESDGYRDGQNRSSKHEGDEVRKDDIIKEGKDLTSGVVGDVHGDDLESILRQRALENLRRFRGDGQPTVNCPGNHKDESDIAVKSSSTAKAELDHINSRPDNGARVVSEDSSYSLQNDEKITDGKKEGSEIQSAKNNICLPGGPDQVTAAGREKAGATVGSSSRKPRLVTSALKQALSNTTTIPKQAHASQDSNQAKLIKESGVGKSATQNAHTLTPSNGNNNDDKVYDGTGSGSGSTEPLTVRDISCNKLEDDGKEGSQLEQKTMSVMRGGEMVQVSYKVYIPKKTPALARRQIRR